jgi:biopolymer transport protein TolR
MAILIKRKRKGRFSVMSDMNVTPMIDVMLVLLVIFMVTAPLMTIGVKVNLPSAKAPKVDGNDVPIVVHMSDDGKIFIGEIEVTLDTLSDKLLAITNENTAETRVFVRGDKSLSYGSIMNVMGRIGSSGFKKIVLITELPKNRNSK